MQRNLAFEKRSQSRNLFQENLRFYPAFTGRLPHCLFYKCKNRAAPQAGGRLFCEYVVREAKIGLFNR